MCKLLATWIILLMLYILVAFLWPAENEPEERPASLGDRLAPWLYLAGLAVGLYWILTGRDLGAWR
jgi:uncharacterized membrane protein YfcA